MTARGIRNNNPGNVERTIDKKTGKFVQWLGMDEDQSGDDRFVIMKTPEYGIRMIVVIIYNYQRRKSPLNTVYKILNTYAPMVENDTGAYIKSVCNVLGVGPDDIIDVYDNSIMLNLIKAIIRHENGEQPYSNEQLLAGIKLAAGKK